MTRPSILTTLTWLTAFLTVFSLYGQTFLNSDPGKSTPVLAILIAAFLSILTLAWLYYPRLIKPSTSIRKISALVMFIALFIFSVFGLLGFIGRKASANDWGILLLQVGTPLLLVLNHQRTTLIQAIGAWCALFASIDAGANMGATAGLWQLADAGGRYDAHGEHITRFGGLTGNSLATGFVALVAVGYISSRLRDCRSWGRRILTSAWLVSIFISLYLADSRRYIGGAIFMVVLIVIPYGRFVPLPVVSATLGLGGIFLTLRATDSENMQRADLMADGWREASSHAWVGEGIRYHLTAAGADFNSLWAVHATESGAIDMAIANGWLATVLFISAAFLALGAKRGKLTWPSVLFTVMTGEIAYTAPIDGFLGSIIFFSCLIYILCDEVPTYPSGEHRRGGG
jgi:hypothetical protein